MAGVDEVAVFEAGTRAINEGDVDAMLAMVDDEVVFEPFRAAVQGAYRGREGMRDFFRDNAESFEVFALEFTEVSRVGELVLATGMVRVRGIGSGAEARVPVGCTAVFRDGKLLHCKAYADPADARREATRLGEEARRTGQA